MNNVLCAIQKFPSVFVYSLQRRSSTTPSEYNRSKHNELIEKIRAKEWQVVESIINEEAYYNALEGVVMCLRTSEEFTTEDYEVILNLYKEKKLS